MLLLHHSHYLIHTNHFHAQRLYQLNKGHPQHSPVTMSLNPNLALNNSETVKAVTLAFCSIHYNFIRDIPAKFGIPNFTQSPDIGQNSDRGISGFLVNPL